MYFNALSHKHFQKIVSLIIAFFLCVGVFVGIGAADEKIYEINSLQDLKDFRDNVNKGNPYDDYLVLLNTDIDLSGESNWQPIGDDHGVENTHIFKGTFDGQGHTISNLRIHDNEGRSSYAKYWDHGLFGATDGATIKNLVLKNVDAFTEGYITNTISIGSLIGWMIGGNVSNCSVSGYVSTGYSVEYVGGMIGKVVGNGKIDNCSVSLEGDITSGGTDIMSSHVGGLIAFCGDEESSCSVSNCFVIGEGHNVKGSDMTNYVGGLIGKSTCDVSNCFVLLGDGTVEGGKSDILTSSVGGLIGSTNGGTVSNCFFSGKVKSGEDVYRTGGLIGSMYYASFVNNCYTTQETQREGGDDEDFTLGGLVGMTADNSYVTRCVALNQFVKSYEGDDAIGRVVGKRVGDDTNIYENYGWNEMKVNDHTVESKEDDWKHGIDTTSKDVWKSLLFWQNVFGADKISYDGTKTWTIDKDWSYESDKSWGLPYLTYFGKPTDIQAKNIQYLNPSPYISVDINSVDDLKAFRDRVNSGENDGYFYVSLHTNLDLKYEEWIPIGYYEDEVHPGFKGLFEGNGYTISNLNITKDEQDHIGLFGYTEGAIINNLTLKNAQLSGKNDVGGLIGKMNGGHVNNCSVKEVQARGYDSIGGLIGNIEEDCEITNCSVFGSVSGEHSSVGGLIGLIRCVNEGKIADCFASCVVESSVHAGGLVGYVSLKKAGYFLIIHCITTGSVKGGDDSFKGPSGGGLIGVVAQEEWVPGAVSVDSCVALNANISGYSDYIGRVCGINNSGTTLSNNFAWDEMIVNGQTVSGTQVDKNGENVSYSDIWGTLEFWEGIFGDKNISVDDPSTIWQINKSNPWGIPYLTSQGIPSQQEAENIQYLKSSLIALDKNGGTGGTNQTRAHVGLSDLYPAIVPPTSEGHYLTGWFTNNTDGVMVIDVHGTLIPSTPGYVDENGKWTNRSDTLTLYAQWEDNLDMNIYTASDLKNFSDNVSAGQTFSGKTVSLMNNLDLSGFENLNPIGTFDHPFKGLFEGNGFTISNLNITKEEQDQIGLFGYTTGATINNLTLKNAQFSGKNDVGGLIGKMNVGHVNNCSVKEVQLRGYDSIGGLIGYIEEDCEITNCSVFGSVSGEHSSVGGLIGLIRCVNEGKIADCFASCVVESSVHAGGLVGYVSLKEGGHFLIIHCITTGSVKGGDDYFKGPSGGGLIGVVAQEEWLPGAVSVDSCVALNANISGYSDYIGRVCGRLLGECYLFNDFAWDKMKVNGHTVSGTEYDKNGENVSNSKIWSRLNYWSSVVGLNISVDDPSTIWHIDVQDNPWGIPYLASQGIPSPQEAENIQYLKPNLLSTDIILDKNGGEGGTNLTMATLGQSALDPAIVPPTSEGHYLTGWFTNTTEEGVCVISSDGTLIPSVEGYVDAGGNWTNTSTNLTLYAQWELNTAHITLDKNGGEGGNDNTTATFGSSVLDPAIVPPTSEGHYLTGWFTYNIAGIPVIYANGTLIPSTPGYVDDDGKWANPSTNLTLYAQWESNTTHITLDKNCGEGGSDNTTATFGSSVLDPAIVSPRYVGHNLLGWFTPDSEGVQIIDANGTLIPSTLGYVDTEGKWINQSAELTLYAQWEDALKIYTASDLKNFSDNVSAGQTFSGKTVYLMNNLDLSGFGNVNPIGTSEHPFSGTFEGNGFTISNLAITKENQDNVGLFGYTAGATINNLTLKNAQIAGNNSVGGLIGMMNGGHVNNCSVKEVQVTGYDSIGGLIGNIGTECKITNCSAFGSVSGKHSSAGGLIGLIYGVNEGTIADCFASCVVESRGNTGGLVGYASDNTLITHCITTGSVKGGDDNVSSGGGLIGIMAFGQQIGVVSVDSCVALNANISGFSDYTGRICGQLVTGGESLSNDFAWDEMKVNNRTVSGTQVDKNGENVSNSDIWSKLDYWKTVFGSNISVDDPSTIWHIDVQGNPWGIPYLASQGIPSSQEAENIQYLNPDTPGPTPTSTTLITLEKNGGTGGTNQTTATVGSSALNPEIISPTCEGYNLTGWFTSNTSGVMVIYANGTLIPSTEGYVDDEGNWENQSSDLTLYAQWEEGPMPPTSTTLITLEKNSGTGGTNQTIATVGSSVLDPTIVPPTYEGHSLTGWFTTNNPEGVRVINADGTLIPSVEGYVDAAGKWKNTSSSLVLYAHWMPVPPSPHHGNGGGGTTIIISETPMPTDIPNVIPTDYPIQQTGVSPSAVPTVPSPSQSPIPIIGILFGLAVEGFLLIRLRK